MSGTPVEVGSTANNYQILARLAVGGMAEIFLARGVSATGVERYCVLKRILRERANDVHFVRMFLEEARLAAQLQHPNVAQVYDIGKLGDSYFFTMEYVHGETVRALIQRARSLRRELPPATILTIVAGSAAGLHHAHERIGADRRPLGIVHRDVSPSNLMVSFEGGVKVVDFGVAKAADRAVETRSGTVKGKISYLSPEQCRGAPLDRRSDLFSLGIVMWELLTTERLFKRGSDFEVMNAIVTEDIVPPSQRCPSVSPELDAICLRLLAKRPEDRFQTGEEVVEALEDAAPRIGAMASSSGLGRFLRELFGQRPEPWHELEQHDAPDVTVTSEPLPPELGVPVDDSMDAKLRKVPTLVQPVVDSGSAAVIPAGARTLPMPAPPEPVLHFAPLPPVMPPPYGAGPNPTGSQSSISTMLPSYPQLPAPGARTRSWPMIVVVALAAIAGSVVVIALMQQADPDATIADARAPSAMAVVEASVGTSAEARVDTSADARVGTSADARVGTSADARVDTPAAAWADTPAVARADAPVDVRADARADARAGAPIDARADAPIDVQVADAPTDAPADTRIARVDAAIDAQPPDARSPDARSPDAAVPAPPPLELAIREARWADALALCGKRVTAKTAAPCVTAACHAKAETRARAWYARVPAASKRALLSTCTALGVELAPKPVPPRGPDPCEKNPMACQR